MDDSGELFPSNSDPTHENMTTKEEEDDAELFGGVHSHKGKSLFDDDDDDDDDDDEEEEEEEESMGEREEVDGRATNLGESLKDHGETS